MLLLFFGCLQIRRGQHYGDMSAMQVSATLHEEYDVPLDFLVGMSVMDQARLLDELIVLKSKETKPRCLFVHVQFGLGNRLRALGSAMAFAQQTNRALVVIWERDFHFNASFHDFFVNDLIIADSLHAKWPFDATRDDAYRRTNLYNYMRKDGPDTISAGSHHLEDSKGYNIYIKTAYIIKVSQPTKLTHTAAGTTKIDTRSVEVKNKTSLKSATGHRSSSR